MLLQGLIVPHRISLITQEMFMANFKILLLFNLELEFRVPWCEVFKLLAHLIKDSLSTISLVGITLQIGACMYIDKTLWGCHL